MNDDQGVSVRVKRRFDATAERVFDAWLDPEMIGRWMFGPALRDEEVVRIVADARAGGAFSFLVRRQGLEIDHVGTYLEIERPRRLVFTWAAPAIAPEDSRVTVEVRPTATGCELTLVHELHPAWAAYAPRSEEGWTTMLGALASLLGRAA